MSEHENQDSASILTESNDMDNDQLKSKGSNDLDHSASIEIPKQPLTSYSGTAVLCLLIAFGGYVFGWDTGTIGGFLNQTDFKRRFGQKNSHGEYYFSKARTGLVVAIFNIGCAIGGIAWSRLGDMYGRKPALAWVTGVYMIGLIISIASINKWYQYFIGRIISGLGVGGIAVYSPLLLSEVAPKHLRGTLVSCYQLMVTMGIFIGYCTNYGTRRYDNSRQWRIPLGLGFAWALFMIIGLSFVPESPRYLVMKDKMEEAKIAVARSNSMSKDDPSVQCEVDNQLAAIELERAEGKAKWSELFSTKGKYLQKVLLGIMIQSFQQLTGANYFFYYGTMIFNGIGIDDPFEAAIVIGTVNFFSTFFGIYFVEKFGRRNCLLWGALGMVACMVIYASVGVTRLYPDGVSHSDIKSKGAGQCMVVFTSFYIFCFATTWAPIAFVIVAETFPLRIKSKGMAISIAANWIWNFLISFFTPFITGAINFYYGYVFMGCLCASWLYVFCFVLETKGLTLEEVTIMWDEGPLPWKSGDWVPPSKRDEAYNAEALANDDKPLWRRVIGR